MTSITHFFEYGYLMDSEALAGFLAVTDVTRACQWRDAFNAAYKETVLDGLGGPPKVRLTMTTIGVIERHGGIILAHVDASLCMTSGMLPLQDIEAHRGKRQRHHAVLDLVIREMNLPKPKALAPSWFCTLRIE